MEAKYTGLQADDEVIPHTIKVNLTPALGMPSSGPTHYHVSNTHQSASTQPSPRK
jgi:hypothetical protein